MLPNFSFKLVSSSGVMFEGPVKQVVAVNRRGEFGVLAQHINFITQLMPDIVTFEMADGPIEHYLLGSGGLAEVKEGAMTIIAGKARKVEASEAQGSDTDLATARRRTKDVQLYWDSATCPATSRRVRIKLVRDGTNVVACSNWPERQGCDQACLSHR